MSKFSSVKAKSRMSKSKMRALSSSEQPMKRGGSQSVPNSPQNELENESAFIENFRNASIVTQSAPNSPQSQRKLLDSQTTKNGPRTNKLRQGQLARANSLSDIYSKADFDKSSSNLTRIRKLSVGSVEVLRSIGLNDTAAERERKFVEKYSNAEQVIERKSSSKTTKVTTQKGSVRTQSQRIITSNVQRQIVTQSSVQQTVISRTNSRSLDDQHVVKYRNRPIILQRKRSLGSIEVSRLQMMNSQNAQKEPPSKGRTYRSSSVGVIKYSMQNSGELRVIISLHMHFLMYIHIKINAMIYIMA